MEGNNSGHIRLAVLNKRHVFEVTFLNWYRERICPLGPEFNSVFSVADKNSIIFILDIF